MATDKARNLEIQLIAMRIPYESEFRFHPTRRWRADFKLADDLLVEVDGGNMMAKIVNGRAVAIGRHTKAADYEKLNEAAVMGYRVLRFTPTQVKQGTAIEVIERALK